MYFLSKETGEFEVDNASKRYIDLYKGLAAVCALITIAIAVVSLVIDGVGTDVVSYFLTMAIRLFGWMASLKYAVDIGLRSKSRLLFCAAMWALTQIVGSGLSVSATDAEDSNSASNLVVILSTVYCLVAICTLAVVSFWLCRIGSSDSHMTGKNGNQTRAYRPYYMPRDDISTHSLQSHGDLRLGHPVAGTGLSAADNLWIQRAKQLTEQMSMRQGRPQSESQHSLSSAPYEPPSEDGTPRGSFYSKNGSATSAVTNPMQAGTVINSWLVNNTLKGNTRQSVRDGMLIKSLAIKVSVADCYCVRVHDELKLLYKVAIYDRNNDAGSDYQDMDLSTSKSFAGVQIISKRYDEMLYLRDRIADDYPFYSFPPLPPPLPQARILSLIAESNHAPTPGADNQMVRLKSSTGKGTKDKPLSESAIELERHSAAMNALLECLITHPQAGQQVLASLRNNYEAELLADSVSQSFKEKSLLLQDPADKGVGAGGGSAGGPVGHHTEFPLLIDSYSAVLAKAAAGGSSSQKSLRARVYGWTDVLTSSTVSLRDRLLRKTSETTIVHFDFEVVYNNTIWICRKRYCQFRALLMAIKRLYADGIGEELRLSQNDFNFPCIEDELSDANLAVMKEVLGENLLTGRGATGAGNQGITSLTEHQENMLTELTMSLDCFIKTLMEIHEPLPPVLMAFLETDTLKVKGKYDIVASTSAEGTGSSCGWSVVKADDANFTQRREFSDLIKNKFNQTTFRSAAEDRGSMKLSAENAVGNSNAGLNNNYYCLTPSTVVPCLNDIGIPDATVLPEVPTVMKLKNNNNGAIGGFTEGVATSAAASTGLGVSVSISAVSVSARSGYGGSEFNGSELEEDVDDDQSQQDADIENDRGSIRESVNSKCGDAVDSNVSDARPISLSANRHDTARSTTLVERKTLQQRATDMLGGGKSAAANRPTLSVHELLLLPEEVLEELSSLLTFLRSNDITAYKATESCRDARGNCVDFITTKEMLCLDMSALSLNMMGELDEELVASSQVTDQDMECGAWVSQFRIRNAIIGTTAFQDICRKVEKLQTIDLEELERRQHLPPAQNVNHHMITNDEKVAFCVNLYNLLSLHASIMLPWPAAAVRSVRSRGGSATSVSSALIGAVVPTQYCAMQRVLWQVHAKYRIGKQMLSLFQLEHGILRSLTPHNVFVTSLINNNSASVVGNWLPSVMPNLDVAIPSIADVKAFSPLIPNLYSNTVSLSGGGDGIASVSNSGFNSSSNGMGSGDPRIGFMLRLPHHTSISWTNVAAHSHRGQKRSGNCFHGVLTSSNIKPALRQMVTLYLSQHVRFTMSQQEGGLSGTKVIVLPYLLHKYAGDFAKWNEVYDSPFALLSLLQPNTSVTKGPKSPARLPTGQSQGRSLSLQSQSESLSRSFKAAKSLAAASANTQWDVVEFQQRTSAGNSVAKVSNVDEAPYSGLGQSSHNSMLVERDRDHIRTTSEDLDEADHDGLGQGCGLWAERELFRLCRLLSSQLEIKDRKYILKVYKDAFLGRHAIALLLKLKEVSSVEEGIQLCNILIEFRLMRSSTGEHWMKNMDLPYYFTGVEPFFPPVSPYFAFIKSHLVSLDDMVSQVSGLASAAAAEDMITTAASAGAGKKALLNKSLEEEFELYYDVSKSDEEFYSSCFVFPMVHSY